MNYDVSTIRTGEEINLRQLEGYLGQRLPTPFDRIEVFQFPAGSSNLTYLIRLGGMEYVLRRPPFGNTVKTAHDMMREYDVLQRLAIIYPPAPEPILYCDDPNVIGAEFYLMERRSGLIVRGDLKQNYLYDRVRPLAAKLDSSDEYRREVCRSFINNLAKLHSLDYTVAGLGRLGKPDGYCERQVVGWTQRYAAAKTHEQAELETVIKWLNERIPVESGASLVHNDYKFDNVILDPDDLTRIIAVLDWEMVTIGDPLMDLGTTLGYWMSKDAGEEMLNMPYNPRVLMENISRRELADMYAEASGRDVSNILYYYVFGTFKIAVIAQQIYARYVRGVTKDSRFANFNQFVSALGRIAHQTIEKQGI